jgi:hypothetical protein
MLQFLNNFLQLANFLIKKYPVIRKTHSSLHNFLYIAIFLIKKKKGIRKMITEAQMLYMFYNGQTPLSEMLSIELIQGSNIQNIAMLFDAAISLSWDNMSANYLVEMKAQSTPKIFENTINTLKSAKLPVGYQPMLIMPYLSENQLYRLASLGISGLDLSGNCTVYAPSRFSVFKSGKPNAFPSTSFIKNVYSKNSSLVARVFFSKARYSRVGEICSEINDRNLLVQYGIKKPMSLSTVSKTLKSLSNDLIVGRDNYITILQPDKALTKLQANYQAPKVVNSVKLNVQKLNSAMTYLMDATKNHMSPIVVTGLSSSTQMAIADRGSMMSLYCTDLKLVLDFVGGSFDDNFPNLELLETQDERVYFDTYMSNGLRWASPVQTYLELANGDKRDKEISHQVKAFLLEK